MHFDDRLATVLRHRAAGDRAARTQFRQLLDLLGSKRAGIEGGRDESLLAAAWLRLAALSEAIPPEERAAMIRDPGLRLRNPALAIHLAEDEPEVAAATLSRVKMDEDDWEALIPRLPVRARGFLRLRKDLPEGAVRVLDRLGIHDRGLPQPDSDVPDETTPNQSLTKDRAEAAKPVPANDPGIEPQEVDEEDDQESIEEDTAIGALVKRIEAFRQARSDTADRLDAPRLPLGEDAAHAEADATTGFSFATDQEGRIGWADPKVAPMVFGMVLDREVLGTAIRFRQPIVNRRVTLIGAPAISGDWIVDATPRFTEHGGQYFGYAGMLRRPVNDIEGSDAPEGTTEADRLRQLLHELKTPVNAIQGFAEIIQQQLFGPTPNEYRALAANIAGDSARMLAGFDEIDRLAKLETGAVEPQEGESDFAAIVSLQLEQLQEVLKPRTAGFEATIPASGLVAMELNEAENLAWRLLATLAGAIGAGEWLQLELAEQAGSLRLCCELPASLSAEEDIFSAAVRSASTAVTAGTFGSGFALRLARAEARSVGGSLARVDDWLLLSLPLLTGQGSAHSDAQEGA